MEVKEVHVQEFRELLCRDNDMEAWDNNTMVID